MTKKEVLKMLSTSPELSVGKLGLRFDRVALQVIGEIQKCSEHCVPDGQVIVVTITAPIHLPSKTALAIETKIENIFTQKNPKRSFKFAIHANVVRIRLMENPEGRKPRLFGFVHNRSTDSEHFFRLAKSWLTR